MKIGGMLILALTLLVTVLAGYNGWRYWQLAQDRMTATAQAVTVDRRRPYIVKDLSSIPYRYSADYTFADETARIHSGRQTIDGSTYETLAQRANGEPVTVYYSRSRPEVNSLYPNSSRNTSVVLALVALLGWGIVVSRFLRG